MDSSSSNPLTVCSLVQLVSLVEGQGQRKSICINPGRLAKGGGSTFAELKYHGTADKMNAWIIIGI